MKAIYTYLVLILSSTAVFSQIPNASFENWDTDQCSFAPDSVPVDWITPCTDGLAYTTGFSPTTDAYSGTFASRLEPAILGDLVAWFVPTITKTAFTVSYIPTQFSGHYKFESADGDSAMVLVYFKEYNSNTSEFDTVLTIQKILHPAAQYTEFLIPVPEIGFQSPPDSVIIYIASSYADINQPYNNDGMDDGILYVDALDMTGTVGIGETNRDNIQVFPVPAKDQLFIKGLDADWDSYQIIDALGRLVAGGKINASQISLNGIKPGAYTLGLMSGSGKQTIQKTIVVD